MCDILGVSFYSRAAEIRACYCSAWVPNTVNIIIDRIKMDGRQGGLFSSGQNIPQTANASGCARPSCARLPHQKQCNYENP